MASNVEYKDSASIQDNTTIRHLALDTLLVIVSIIAFITFHELIHLAVGRAVGLPAQFVSPSSIAVSDVVALRAEPYKLALMNGVAPIVSILMGVAINAFLIARGASLPDILRRFLAWWAIAGIPYAGLQLMLSGGSVIVTGTGNDFAAVLVGYLGISKPIMAVFCFIGILVFIAAGLLVRPALAKIEGLSTQPQFHVSRLRVTSIGWRRISAAILGFVLLGIALFATTRIAQGNESSVILLSLLGPIIWIIILAILIPWRTPEVSILQKRWILPAVVAGLLFIPLGIVSGSEDYAVILPYILAPILTITWAQASVEPTISDVA